VTAETAVAMMATDKKGEGRRRALRRGSRDMTRRRLLNGVSPICRGRLPPPRESLLCAKRVHRLNRRKTRRGKDQHERTVTTTTINSQKLPLTPASIILLAISRWRLRWHLLTLLTTRPSSSERTDASRRRLRSRRMGRGRWRGSSLGRHVQGSNETSLVDGLLDGRSYFQGEERHLARPRIPR